MFGVQKAAFYDRKLFLSLSLLLLKTLSPVCSENCEKNKQLHSAFGIINTPTAFPSNGDKVIVCGWNITVPKGHQVQLNISVEYSYYHRRCIFQLKIFDGPDRCISPILARFCDQTNTIIISNRNHVFVEAACVSYWRFTSFVVSFAGVKNKTGATAKRLVKLGGPKGNFSSPRYPLQYQPQSLIEWQISVPSNYSIKMHFWSFFLRQHNNNPDCLEFREGPTRCSPVLFTYCGRRIVSPLYVRRDEVWVTLQVYDRYEQAPGFYADFQAVSSIEEGIFGCPNGTVKLLNATKGFITSPNFPRNYPSGQECHTLISVPKGMGIFLKFHRFDLQESTIGPDGRRLGSLDYLQIRSTRHKPHKLLHTYRFGRSPPKTHMYYLQNILISFISDTYSTAGGFNMSYTALPLNFKKVIPDMVSLINGSETFNTPNYPLPYPTMHYHLWKIAARRGFIIRLTFLHFDLEQSAWCEADYLRVYDATSTSVGWIDMLCGKGRETTFSSSGSIMLVEFWSDADIVGKGFQATAKSTTANEVLSCTFKENLCGWQGSFVHLAYGLKDMNGPMRDHTTGKGRYVEVRMPSKLKTYIAGFSSMRLSGPKCLRFFFYLIWGKLEVVKGWNLIFRFTGFGGEGEWRKVQLFVPPSSLTPEKITIRFEQRAFAVRSGVDDIRVTDKCDYPSCPLEDLTGVNYTCTLGDKYRSVCTFFCTRSNFLLLGSSRRICRRTGSWTGSKPSCYYCPPLCKCNQVIADHTVFAYLEYICVDKQLDSIPKGISWRTISLLVD